MWWLWLILGFFVFLALQSRSGYSYVSKTSDAPPPEPGPLMSETSTKDA